MEDNNRRAAKLKPLTALMLLSFISSVVIIAVAHTWDGRAPIIAPPPAYAMQGTPPPLAGRRGGIRDHGMQSEVITVRPTGFNPAEMTRPKGRFLLILNNRSGATEINVGLTRENGNRVREVKINRKKPNWSDLIDLPPGRYKLTEESHPKWACQITITPQ